MKRFLIGFLAALVVAASVVGASSKGPRSRRAADEAAGSSGDCLSDQALWI